MNSGFLPCKVVYILTWPPYPACGKLPSPRTRQKTFTSSILRPKEQVGAVSMESVMHILRGGNGRLCQPKVEISSFGNVRGSIIAREGQGQVSMPCAESAGLVNGLINFFAILNGRLTSQGFGNLRFSSSRQCFPILIVSIQSRKESDFRQNLFFTQNTP